MLARNNHLQLSNLRISESFIKGCNSCSEDWFKPVINNLRLNTLIDIHQNYTNATEVKTIQLQRRVVSKAVQSVAQLSQPYLITLDQRSHLNFLLSFFPKPTLWNQIEMKTCFVSNSEFF